MESQVREISMRKLLWRIVLGWRSLLIWAVVFAVLLGAGSYWKAYKQYQAALHVQTDAAEETQYVFTEDEQTQIDTVLQLQEQLQDVQTYLQESVLMNIDPYEENLLCMDYYVETDYQFDYTKTNRPDYTSAVVAAYMQYAQSGDLVRELAGTADCDQKYIEELIRVESSSDTKVFRIKLIYPDTDVLEKMAELVDSAMQEQSGQIAEQVGSHSLKLLSESQTVQTDLDLANQQKAEQDLASSYQTAVTEKKTAMTEQQLAQLETDTLQDQSGEQTEQTLQTAVKPSLSVKYIGIGFLLGIFLAAAWIVWKMLMTGELQDADELTEIYKLRVFGSFLMHERTNAADRMLLKWKNRNKKQLTDAQRMDITVSNLELACESGKITEIYLTGSEIEKADRSLIEELIKRLGKAGIGVVYGENICYDAAGLRRLAEVGTAVLVEQAERSKYQEIEKEMRLMKEQNVTLLGCIGIERELA